MIAPTSEHVVVAGEAEQPTNALGTMIVIHIQRTPPWLSWTATDFTDAALKAQHLVVLLQRKSVLPDQVLVALGHKSFFQRIFLPGTRTETPLTISP